MMAQKNYPKQLNLSDFSDKSLLILDDDDPLRGRLSRAMQKKGFLPKEAKNVSEGLQIVKNSPPAFALIDLRLEDGSGIDVVKELSKSKKDCRIVMLTGYGNLPTAVAAVKAGAIDYMAKPVDADDVEAALLASPESKAKPPENPMSADRVKWEHSHRVYKLCNRTVSETFLLHNSKTLFICSHLTLSADIGFSGGFAFDSGIAKSALSTSSASTGLGI